MSLLASSTEQVIFVALF